ncbi:hypothetical protein GCM10009780_18790 [Actinomadura alba]
MSGRTDLILSDSKLRVWADALDRLDAGEDIAWMAMSRGPSVFIRLTGDRDCPVRAAHPSPSLPAAVARAVSGIRVSAAADKGHDRHLTRPA